MLTATAGFIARVRSVVAWLALAAVLQGCGPGVGGSGTGQGLDAFGASAASLCGSDIATVLACPVNSPAAPPASGASGAASGDVGSGRVYFADAVDGRRVAVTVQGNSIEVSAPCARISFIGQWGVLAGQAARFYGINTDGNSAQPAQVRAAVDSGGLLVTVQDAAGNTLLGPVWVTARAAPASAGAC
jgi:hypothetical protein